LAWLSNKEPGMRKFTEHLSAEDRRVYRRWLGGLVGFYGALMAVTAGVIAGDQWSKRMAHESATAEAVGDGPLSSAGDGTRVRHAAKYQ
jgi:hypothetical protein